MFELSPLPSDRSRFGPAGSLKESPQGTERDQLETERWLKHEKELLEI